MTQKNNYTVTEIEMLGIMEGIRHFSPFLSNRRFEVVTDHVSLQYIENMKLQIGRLARWALFLMGYDFEVIFQNGRHNQVADGISRRPYSEVVGDEADREFEDMLMTIDEAAEEPRQERIKGPKTTLIETEYENEQVPSIAAIAEEKNEPTAEITVDMNDVAAEQRLCPDFRDIIKYIEEGVLPAEDDRARKITLTAVQYDIIDGILYHLHQSRKPGMAEINPVHRQLCLPRIYREEIANGHHVDNSHIGFDRLFASVKKKYYWQLMYSQLRELVLGCQDCQQAKKQTKEEKAPMCPLPVVPIVERIHCDLLGPVTKSVDGYQYILLVVDSFSRFPEAFPLKTQKAEEVAKALYSVICRWGAST